MSRYNSISYYAKRFSVRVEGASVPVRVYRDVGVGYLVTNLPRGEEPEFSAWVASQGVAQQVRQVSLVDYKGNERVCSVYRL